MAQEVEVRQYWVRNDKGTVWGPLSFAAIELFCENGVLVGKLQASADGENFADPGRFTDVRDAFPKDAWGSTEPLPAAFRPASAAPTAPPAGPPGRPGAPPGAPPVMGRAPGRPPGAPPGAPPVMARAPGSPPSGKVPVVPHGGAAQPGSPPTGKVPAAPAAPAGPKTGNVAAVPAAPAAAAPGLQGVPGSGALDESLSPFRLYYLLVAQSATGKLSFTSGEVTYELLLKKGVPHQVRSSAPADAVLTHLGEKKLLTAEQVAQAEGSAGQFGNDPVAAAFALRLVKDPGAFLGALSAHATSLLQRMLKVSAGSFTWDGSVAVPPTAMALGEKWKLLCQAARTLTGDEARARLGERMHMPVMKSGERVTLPELGLTAAESRIAAAFEGVRSVAQLAEGGFGDADAVARICYLLGEVELASFAAVHVSGPKAGGAAAAEPEPETIPPASEPVLEAAPEPAPAPAPPPVAPKAPVARPAAAPPPGGPPRVAPAAGAPKGPPVVGKAPGAPPGAPGGPPKLASAVPGKPPVVAPAAKPPAVAPAAPAIQVPQDVPGLQALLEKQKKQNHFEVLGLPQTATGPQIKTTYLQAVKAYHPDSTPPGAGDEVLKLKEQIFARINDANTVLSDDKARAAYIEELKAGPVEQVDVSAIFQAEEIFTKACIVVKARKYADAVKMFDEALKLNDKEAEFYAWRGWAVFMTAQDRKAAFPAGLQAMEKALKLNARCAPAAFFAGQMCKLVADNAAALKWFTKAVELDPNYLEAKSELRALGK